MPAVQRTPRLHPSIDRPEVFMAKSRFNRALADLSGVFKKPQAIVEAEDLTGEQKVTLLKQWETDLRLLMVATEENMTGDTPGRTAESLRAVLKALLELGVSDGESPQAPTKSGGN
jgi:hypothetical protein